MNRLDAETEEDEPTPAPLTLGELGSTVLDYVRESLAIGRIPNDPSPEQHRSDP